MDDHGATLRPFRPRARLMHLLGDQLIRDAGIGLVELVKNAYDADATHCLVRLEGVHRDDDAGGRIVIEDDGCGMDLDTVLGVWLEPGTEHRRQQRRRGERTPGFGRVPLGEKGVGRFAAHKLGRRIHMVTRRAGCPEVVVEVDWRQFDRSRYLEEVPVRVTERTPQRFTGDATGTRIEILDLRDRPWDRVRVQTVHRAVHSIRSPFAAPDRFAPELVADAPPPWLAGLLRAEDVLDQALFRFHAHLAGDRLTYDYDFRPGAGLEGVEERRVEGRELPLRLKLPDPDGGGRRLRPVDLGAQRIGPVEIELSIYDRDPKVLRLTSTDPVGLGRYLDRAGGVRVYREGVRIYDYGEPGNDWLTLGARRLKMPKRRLSNNQVIGAVHLRLEASGDLVEKTNREGFVENAAFETFRRGVLFALAQAEAERSVDRSRVRRVHAGGGRRETVADELTALRDQIEARGLGDELGPPLRRLEERYREAMERLLMAAGTGLNLSTLIHEAERMIRDLAEELARAAEGGADVAALARRAGAVVELLDGLTWLTRRTGRADHGARDLVRQAVASSASRLRAHRVEVSGPDDAAGATMTLRSDRRLVLAALMNLIDNAVYWMDVRGGAVRRLHAAPTRRPDGRPGIVVADSGPGLMDPAEDLVEPFFTRKPGGMGLGLHIAAEVMKAHGGRLRFPTAADMDLPPELDGAVVLLEFAADD